MASKNSSDTSVDINLFLKKTQVESIIIEIEKGFVEKGGRPVYSDIYKTEKDETGKDKTYEYVDYVQEGGGVLGVALVGYTYVLERLGFRFLKLAGTSAGAINTLLMASVQPQHYPGKNYQYQSEMILDEMLSFDLWKLVDGHWFAKWLIKTFVKKSTAYSQLKFFIQFCLIGAILYGLTLGMLRLYQFGFMQNFIGSSVYQPVLIAGAAAFLLLVIQWVLEIINVKKLNKTNDTLDPPANKKQASTLFIVCWVFIFFLAVPFLLHLVFYYGISYALIGHLPENAMNIVRGVFHLSGGLAMLGLVILLIAFIYFKGRFARAGFGINPGSKFLEWMEEIMRKNNTETTEKLMEVMNRRLNPGDLQLRPDAAAPDRTTVIGQPFFSMMASDVTMQTKAEFPRNANDYWANPDKVNPAEYVRASMSIPIFFSPHKVQVVQQVQDKSEVFKQKATVADRSNVLNKEIWLVDGGVLSNFPINIFHNPSVKIARMPTFGVKLEDEKHLVPGDEYKPAKISMGKFLGNIFSTIRYYYDKDFLKRNAIYEKGIAHIDVAQINWLNFGMSEEIKIDLFNRGAAAAKIFLLGGEYYVDGRLHDTRMVAPNDPIGEAFKDGFNWEKFKHFRKEALEADMKIK